MRANEQNASHLYKHLAVIKSQTFGPGAAFDYLGSQPAFAARGVNGCFQAITQLKTNPSKTVGIVMVHIGMSFDPIFEQNWPWFGTGGGPQSGTKVTLSFVG